MRIVDIKERTASIASPIRNAYIDFRGMTVSVAAVVTDVIRDGKPVVGYGFNSNGRYAQGCLLRERFLPRVREADPSTYVSGARDNLDPFRLRDILILGMFLKLVGLALLLVLMIWVWPHLGLTFAGG